MRRQLKLFDAVCIIVGVIVGVGIYAFAPQVARAAGSPVGVLSLWVAGGCLSLCGALCYAELASAYPHAGGDYVFLSRAYGPWAGFQFAWFQLTVIRPGDIAAMALVFAQYATQLAPAWFSADASPLWHRVLGVAGVLLLTGLHAAGVHFGKRVHNLLTVVKIAGILVVLTVAVLAAPQQGTTSAAAGDPTPLGLAMIFVLFTYGGWNEMGYLAAELERPQQNVLRGLVIGLALVTVLYVLMNLAFLYVLGRSGLSGAEAVAVEVVRPALPRYGAALIAGLICVSALGAASGLIFTGARISFALGTDYPLFRYLGRWHAQRQTPLQALLIQGLLASVIIVILGQLVATLVFTSAAVYIFYLATTVSTIVLRWREPNVPRPYRVTGYPITPLVFAAACIALIDNVFRYMWNVVESGKYQAVALVVIAAVGGLLFFSQRRIDPGSGRLPSSP